ncbi:MAG: mannitol dehydrogenase family protein [Nocardioides sp.]|nr:mannitol dehydrogenase family protein [Nocardioides sp.]
MSPLRGDLRRLDRTTVGALGPGIEVPSYDARSLRPGIVHLGSGVFHRAHQAVYLHDLAQAGISDRWGVVGTGMRTRATLDDLARQDGLYSVTEIGPEGRSVRVVGVVRDQVDAVADPQALVRRMADPHTQVVTLTVTAPAYELTAAPGTRGVFDLVVDALTLRRRAGLGPFTVLSCDNLPDNGRAARACVLAVAEGRDPRLATWIAENVTFPSSMVDRITPPADADLGAWLRRRHGFVDAAPVVCESFRQWVVEDAFCAERPPLDAVGVQLVTDARPFVAMKTSLLNATHVALGFLGGAAGHTTTADAMRDPVLVATITRMMRHEVAPLLDAVPGVDLDAYRADLLQRFANETLADPLERLRGRGSVRVLNYVAPSLRRAVQSGASRSVMTDVLAAWINHLAHHGDAPEVATDPLADVLLPLARTAPHDVRPFLVAAGLGDLAAVPSFASSLQRRLTVRKDHLRAAAS